MGTKTPFGGSGGPGANPQQMLQRAVALHQQGRLADAVRMYKAVLTQAPRAVPALTYCGAALLDLKQVFEGTQMLQNAVTLAPDNAEAHAFLGNARQMAGKLTAARDSYTKALELKPDNASAQNNLGVLLQRMGDNADAAARFHKAVEVQPDYAQAWNNLGQALVTLDQIDAAIDAAQKAVDLQPKYPDALNTLGSALSRAGRHDQAMQAYRQALDLQPELISAHNNLAVASVIAGQADAAVAACDKALALDPCNVPALATKVVALSEAGRTEDLDRLQNFDAHVRSRVVDPTPDFPDLATFNTALVQHILAHPSLTYELEGHATRKGKHTGELLVEPKGPMATFERMINQSVWVYQDALDPAGSHPVEATMPEKWKLTAWSVVLEEEGHQIPHIHESGWLSGVYYPKLPATMGPAQDDPRGWIEFGQPQDLYAVRRDPPIRLIRPEEGLMILFPSYLFHRTVPTGTNDLRISIAFDVMRA